MQLLVDETVATLVTTGAVMVVVSVHKVSTEENRGSITDDLRVVVAYLFKIDEQSLGPSLEGSKFRASSPSLIQGRVQVLAADVDLDVDEDVDLGAIGFAKACWPSKLRIVMEEKSESCILYV